MSSKLIFLAWHLADMLPPDKMGPLLRQIGCTELSMKIADGIFTFNSIGGNDKPLIAFKNGIEEYGVEFTGWHYVYGTVSPGAQGDRAMERREKLDIGTIYVNIEDKDFRQLDELEANRWAKVYMDKQHQGTEYGHMSHRYPELHDYIPHRKMINHEKMDDIIPMVYWVQAHNPVDQLLESIEQYRKINGSKPYIAIGPAYSVGTPGKPGYWEPTVNDFLAFDAKCVELGIDRGYYSIDYILNHHRTDWLNAIAVGEEPPEPPPPPVVPDAYEVVNCSWLNGRSDPKVVDDNRIVSVKAGQRVRSLKEQSGDWYHINMGYFNCWMHGDYLEPVPQS